MRFAKELQTLCNEYSVPFIVNDDVELAIELDADGVHVGQDDEGITSVREKWEIKLSAYLLIQLKKRCNRKWSRLFRRWTYFPNEYEKDTKAVQGTKGLAYFREQGITVPIVGIGGITIENTAAVIEAGADGVSVISAISLAESAYESTRKLAEEVKVCREGRVVF